MYTKHYAANNVSKTCFKVDAKSSDKGSFVLPALVTMETTIYSNLFQASLVRANVSLSALSFSLSAFVTSCLSHIQMKYFSGCHNHVFSIQGKPLYTQHKKEMY